MGSLLEQQKRAMELMGLNEGTIKANEKFDVEISKLASDGNVYAIIREQQKHYIKKAANKEGLVVEDFDYLGGEANRHEEAYKTFESALTRLQLKLKSINEYHGGARVDCFKSDCLIKEEKERIEAQKSKINHNESFNEMFNSMKVKFTENGVVKLNEDTDLGYVGYEAIKDVPEAPETADLTDVETAYTEEDIYSSPELFDTEEENKHLNNLGDDIEEIEGGDASTADTAYTEEETDIKPETDTNKTTEVDKVETTYAEDGDLNNLGTNIKKIGETEIDVDIEVEGEEKIEESKKMTKSEILEGLKKEINEKIVNNTYVVTVKHDKGTSRLQINASSEESAKKRIMDIEGCPSSAIKSVKLKKEQVFESNRPDSTNKNMFSNRFTGINPEDIEYDSENLDERYKSDEDIEAEFAGFTITNISLNKQRTDIKELEGVRSGDIEIEFPDAEESVGGGTDTVIDQWIQYEPNGRIAFNHWYPEKTYKELVSAIQKKIDEESLTENTTTASVGGSYDVPFPMKVKRNPKTGISESITNVSDISLPAYGKYGSPGYEWDVFISKIKKEGKHYILTIVDEDDESERNVFLHEKLYNKLLRNGKVDFTSENGGFVSLMINDLYDEEAYELDDEDDSELSNPSKLDNPAYKQSGSAYPYGKQNENKNPTKKTLTEAKNSDVIASFLSDDRDMKVGNLIKRGNILINYETPIAKNDGETIFINNKKYSVTTTTITNYLARQAEKEGYNVEYVEPELISEGKKKSIVEAEYKLKVPAPQQPVPAPMPVKPAQPESTETATETGNGGDEPIFNDEKFDAGVDVNEEEDPKKYLEKLTGKLAQTLRTYSKDEGADYELEKYILNSIISATHTSQMEPEDQQKIIKKVEEAGSPDEADVQAEPEAQQQEVEPTNSEVSEPVKTENFDIDLDEAIESEMAKIGQK